MVYSAACWLPFHVKMQLQELCLPFHSIAANIADAAQPGWRLLLLVNLIRLLFRHFCSSCAKTKKSGWNVTNLVWGWVTRHRCWVSRSVTQSLSLLFCPLSGGSAISLSLFHVCFHISIFLVNIKEEIIPIIRVRRGAGSLTKESKTSSFIRTTWLTPPPTEW